MSSVSLINGHIDDDYIDNTADLVEVVRCKNCKKYADFDIHNSKRFTFHFCNKFQTVMEENDYCSYGERRDVK